MEIQILEIFNQRLTMPMPKQAPKTGHSLSERLKTCELPMVSCEQSSDPDYNIHQRDNNVPDDTYIMPTWLKLILLLVAVLTFVICEDLLH